MIENSEELNTTAAAVKLDDWIEAEDFRGYDPHDALNSPFLNRLSSSNRFLGIVFLQSLKRLPLNPRPALDIEKGYNPKAMGLFLKSYLRKYELFKQPQHLRVAQRMALWLVQHISPGYHGACWGYNFPWPNRGFFAPIGTPTVVNTAFIGFAFLEAYRLLGSSDLLDVARSACDFVLVDLARTVGEHGSCFSYTPLDRRQVHNANMLGATLLARVGAFTGEDRLIETASSAVEFTVGHQRPDGSWPYGVGGREAWTDNFHTGYVLECLHDFIDTTGQENYVPHLEAGLQFYRDHFFLEDGAPRYYSNSTHPIDIHSASQAILTFLKLSSRYPELDSLARHVAGWTITHMQSREGFFYYQIYRNYTIRIPYMRWAQAWMQLALVELEYGGRTSTPLEARVESSKRYAIEEKVP